MYCANPAKPKKKSCKGRTTDKTPKELKHLRNTYSNYLENNLGIAFNNGLRAKFYVDCCNSKIDFDEKALSKAYNEFITGKNIIKHNDDNDSNFDKENEPYIDANNPKNPASIPSSFNCKKIKKNSRNLKAEINEREMSQKYSNRSRKLSRGETKSEFELFKSQKHERRYSDFANKPSSYFKYTQKEIKQIRKPSLNNKASTCMNKIADDIIKGEWINLCTNKRYLEYKNLSNK